jgi:hypothetical protein
VFSIKEPKDRTLFFNSTFIHIRDGGKYSLLGGKMAGGLAPKDIAPNLYKLVRFKKKTVHVELQNQRWINDFMGIQIPDLLEEFVDLHIALSMVTLQDSKDTITWKWTPNGQFSVTSAYAY